MSRYISDTLRAEVAERANFCCEYCRLPLRYSLFRFQVDHIVSLKHGGQTVHIERIMERQILINAGLYPT